MTNSSLGMTSASLTHMIKMSEPLVTTTLMTVMGKIDFSFDILWLIITIVITAVGSEAATTSDSTLTGVLLALGSNVCLAVRNTGIKYFYPEDNNNQNQSKTTVDGFAMISLSGFLSLLPLWILISFLSPSISLSPSYLISAGGFLYAASICHSLYNVISITCVLSAFNPLQHALLNVVKRVSIVLVFYLFVQKIPSPLNIISGLACLTTSIIGTKVNI